MSPLAATYEPLVLQPALPAGPDAEGAEIHADHRLVELAADAGGEEVLLD